MEPQQTLSDLAKDYNIRLTTKKVYTGTCQVNFTASTPEKKDLYGFVWVDSKATLREVVWQISKRLKQLDEPDTVKHIGMFPVGKPNGNDVKMVIFDMEENNPQF